MTRKFYARDQHGKRWTLVWSDDRNSYVVAEAPLLAFWDSGISLWIVTVEDDIDHPAEYAPNKSQLGIAISTVAQEIA